MPMSAPLDFTILTRTRPARAGSLQEIYHACSTNDLPRVQRLIQDRDRPQEYLDHALLGAVSNGPKGEGYPELVRYLLGKGARVTYSVALAAAKVGSVGVFEALVDVGGWDVNENNMNFGPILPQTVNYEPLLRWFLSRDANPNVPSPNGVSALSLAASTKGLPLLELLVSYGAHPAGTRALHSAAESRYGDSCAMMDFLLRAGADVNLDDMEIAGVGYHGKGTALRCAIDFWHAPRVRFLVERGAVVTAKEVALARQKAPGKGDATGLVGFLEETMTVQQARPSA